jgi:hypothetical protein
VPHPRLFVFERPAHRRQAAAILERLPALTGRPLHICEAHELCDPRGPVHGGSLLRERRILLDCTRAEFPRILVHEIFHFAWLRAGNPARRAFETLLAAEWRAKVPGELGWSAEGRKAALGPGDVRGRTRKWREYCCEAFCDTAAWLYSGLGRHPEFTLAAGARRNRRAWFEGIERRGFSI